MKNLKALLVTCVLVMVLSVIGGTQNASAAGTKYLHHFPLNSSGSGGVAYMNRTINSGPYFSACGSVSYKISHEVSYGAYSSTSFKFNSTAFTISNLSGSVTGGVGFISNYENTKGNYYDYRHSGNRLYAGTKYSFPWNRTIPLGSSNKNAHYDVTTTSGYPNPAIICNNEDNIVMDVGGRSLAAIQATPVSEDFKENINSLSDSLGVEYEVKNTTVNSKAMVNHFYSDKKTAILTQQNDSPINVNNVNEQDFVQQSENDFDYELGHFTREDDTKMDVIRFKKDDVYMALVTDLPIKKSLKIVKDILKNK